MLPAVSAMTQDALGSLQIPVRLAPPVFIDHIGERDTADWPEPAHRVADRQRGIGMDAVRQAESGLGFLLEISRKGPSMSRHDNNSGFTTTNRSGSLNILQHVRPLGRSGWLCRPTKSKKASSLRKSCDPRFVAERQSRFRCLYASPLQRACLL